MPINVINATKGKPKYEYNVNKLETEKIICDSLEKIPCSSD